MPKNYERLLQINFDKKDFIAYVYSVKYEKYILS